MTIYPDYWLPGFLSPVLIMLLPALYLWVRFGVEVFMLRLRYELKRRYG